MKNTEQELKSLFDYQQFEKNDKLEKLINETQTRYARELSDEDLSLVNAAGEIASIDSSKVGADNCDNPAGIGGGKH